MRSGRENGKHIGTFDISPDYQILGELKVAGPKSRLRLHSPEAFPTHQIPDGCATGILQDLTKISLIDCITPRAPGHSSGAEGTYYFAKVVPHFIIVGDEFVRPRDEVIIKIVAYLDDVTVLFRDFGAYGAVLFDAEPLVKQILAIEPNRRDHQTGPNARILYYTGRDELINAKTALGRLVVQHRPGFRSGGNRDGGLLREEIAISLSFDSPLTFHEANYRIDHIINYFGLLVGRPQELRGLYIRTAESSNPNALMKVHSVMDKGRSSTAPNGRPSSHDVLIDGVRDPIQFSSVTAAWLERQELWHDSRWRFFNSFAEERFYDINRLVASANMFDILPDSAVPSDIPLTPKLTAAQAACRQLFKELPPSTATRQSRTLP